MATQGSSSKKPGLLGKSPRARLAWLGMWSGLAILVLVSATAYRTVQTVVDATAEVVHAHEVIERLGEVRSALAEAESARRAHGLSGDDDALVGYADSIERLESKEKEVRALTLRDSREQQSLDELDLLLKTRVASFNASIAQRQRNEDSPEKEAALTKKGRADSARIYSVITRMVGEELRLLDQHRQETAQSVADLRFIKIIGMLVSIAILLVAFLQLHREIVRGVQLEQLARENEESLATTLMSIGDGVIATDAAGGVIRINRAAEMLLGRSGDPAIGKMVTTVFQIIHAETRAAIPDLVEQTVREAVTITRAEHLLLLRADGSELPIAASCAPVRDAKGRVRGAVLVFRDVSQEQQARKLQETAQRQIIVSERMASIGTLAAGVAHEINNPLAYVTTNLDMIIEEARLLSSGGSAGTKELEELAIEARQGAERVRKIVRGLKTFSRADEERVAVVDIRSVMELSINMAFNEIRHRARLVKDYLEIPLVDADEARLAQVFINLLVNAAQAIPEGNTNANEIRVTTSTDSAGRAVVTVRDTGPGIPAAVIGRIFDPFFTTKPVGVGTGLGLSICHNIIAGMGGEISVASVVGHGTTFRIVLPASKGLLAAPSAPSVVAPAAGPQVAVLIVDDDTAVGASMGRVLRDHQVTIVTKAKEALALLASGKRFEVILLDLMMPEMSGMDLYDELARSYPEAARRVVFVTGGAFTPGADAFLDRVPNERIEKPFDTKNVRALVRRLAG